MVLTSDLVWVQLIFNFNYLTGIMKCDSRMNSLRLRMIVYCFLYCFIYFSLTFSTNPNPNLERFKLVNGSFSPALIHVEMIRYNLYHPIKILTFAFHFTASTKWRCCRGLVFLIDRIVIVSLFLSFAHNVHIVYIVYIV